MKTSQVGKTLKCISVPGFESLSSSHFIFLHYSVIVVNDDRCLYTNTPWNQIFILSTGSVFQLGQAQGQDSAFICKALLHNTFTDPA